MGFEDERERDDNDYSVSEDTRKRAHKALDQWLNEASAHGYEVYRSGLGGSFGKFVLTAVAESSSVELHVERSLEDRI